MMRLIQWLLGIVMVSNAASPAPLIPVGQVYKVEAPWKAQIGDDPTWAAPAFDDAGWRSAYDIPRHDGYVWYRQTIALPPGNGSLSLWIPTIFSSGEVYLNGQAALEYGVPESWWTHRRDVVPAVLIPDSARKAGTVVVAVRVRALMGGPGLAGTVLVGDSAQIEAWVENRRFLFWRNSGFAILVLLLPLLTALAAIVYWRGRNDRLDYLWFALIFLGYVAGDIDTLRPLGVNQGFVLLDELLMVIAYYGAWRFFSGDGKSLWSGKYTKWMLAICAVVCVLCVLRRTLLVPLSIGAIAVIAWIAFTTLLNTVQVVSRFRRGDREPLWFFMPYSIVAIGEFVYTFRAFTKNIAGLQIGGATIRESNTVLIAEPFVVDLIQVGQFLTASVMATILLRRLIRLNKEQTEFVRELEAAREVQALLVPTEGVKVVGLDFEASCLPARTVGGDFYQFLPMVGGGAIVVVGDVSGKGLKAAMLVSLAVGILRNEKSTSPASILSALNAGIVGRTGGASSPVVVPVSTLMER
jgi:sigma-B regulation protein RsbU (phosphoserine phosphatase)